MPPQGRRRADVGRAARCTDVADGGRDTLLALRPAFPATLAPGAWKRGLIVGVGSRALGIDRLLMRLTGWSIRQNVLFPLTRPRGGPA